MPGSRGTSTGNADGGYAVSRDLLPGIVVSTVGYSSPPVAPGGHEASSSAAPPLHRGLPSPYLTFIFTLDGPMVSGTSPEHARGKHPDRNDIVVAGLHDAPSYVVQPAGQAGIQLSVHPLGARELFGTPAGQVPWTVTEGVDLLGAEVGRVQQRLLEQDSWPARFAILADYLRCRQERSRSTSRPELTEAWQWLARSGGRGVMDDLARHVALSPRQLRTLFHRELGIGPKQVARLMRFHRARRMLASVVAAGGPVDLTGLALRCGYFDHPHLTGEFRRFSGLSPTRWIAEERRNIQAGGHLAGSE
jgi:AraC-like DNA-binding protein